MKIVIILVVLLALVGGGLFGVASFAPQLLPPQLQTLMGIEVPEPTEPVEEKKPENTALIDVEALTIPIFEDGDVNRFLVMDILLEVEAGPKQAYVTQQMPRIIDTILTHVHALAALDIEPGIADRQFLKERLLAKLDEVIGKDYVLNILFQNLFERPLG
ncbi:flagellar basal body-associated FliL family protein [Thalassobaculum sp. OXR-137]|uniref:flagellar basal body-associated FliL family protein n=1 Tax=Thalassobaculum sp. OXR-137 TaxID=3100173 RepID=UPI002AC95D55|nr:flagellar basal body-associated FliL family protein [Thalassobaculum sp. OXR-137]WPZ33271.1 flagellar basal body-associated FliL family protein [Thalassobaculum sp. OXR-137]